jgi:hypothetical protein
MSQTHYVLFVLLTTFTQPPNQNTVPSYATWTAEFNTEGSCQRAGATLQEHLAGGGHGIASSVFYHCVANPSP